MMVQDVTTHVMEFSPTSFVLEGLLQLQHHAKQTAVIDSYVILHVLELISLQRYVMMET